MSTPTIHEGRGERSRPSIRPALYPPGAGDKSRMTGGWGHLVSARRAQIAQWPEARSPHLKESTR